MGCIGAVEQVVVAYSASGPLASEESINKWLDLQESHMLEQA